MHGYGAWQHRARAAQTALYARAIVLRDSGGRELVFCCLDLGYVTHAMRAESCTRIAKAVGPEFDEERFVLTCTHTHSGPGGCAHEALYNVVTPGFRPDHLEAVVTAIADAVLTAREHTAPVEVGLSCGSFEADVPVAWNRSLRAYNRNPEVEPRSVGETHLALDREMAVLGLYRGGRPQALISLFGVHATCLGNSLDRHDGDNKGYAATFAEEHLRSDGATDPVAIFAQATAGDVSPHYHGPGDIARRRRLRGEKEYAYARRNGELQCELALACLGKPQRTVLSGGLDGVLSYVDLTHQRADPRFADGEAEAHTSDACHGVAFFAGTPVDGPGMPAAVVGIAARAARLVKTLRLRRRGTPEHAYYRDLYASQGPKDILLEASRKRILGQELARFLLPGFVDPLVAELKRQAGIGAIRKSALVPTVLPLQVVRIGQLAIACCPGEFTTVAGQRLAQAIASETDDPSIGRLLVCTYCNDYMGYVTTREEYQEQAYEGGHTIFGQWTLAAFQTCFARLSRELLKPEPDRDHDRTTRPPAPPAEELALRSDLPVPKR